MNFRYTRIMQLLRRILGIVPFLVLLCSARPSRAFSLLGPYTPWMDTTNGYRGVNDIGGGAHRSGLPLERSRRDLRLLQLFCRVFRNERHRRSRERHPGAQRPFRLRRASCSTNYAMYALRYNYVAESQQLYDLKTATLALLLEQMGLGAPVRNMFDLVRWDPLFLTYQDESS